MTTILCTLYNSLYLDKGLVLYDSLCESAKDFKLYVLCMDEKCYEVLTDLKQEHHIPVRLADFEAGDEELLAAKANRPMGEYCWTCSSSFIRYIIKHYQEESCTYIDADMYFYNDPQVLIDEMIENSKSVLIVPHWFHSGNIKTAEKVGLYCVEFNTFLNTPESLEVLEYWRNRCLEKCTNLEDGIHWGDQKYLEELDRNFKCVHICNNRGAGLAKWNIYPLMIKDKRLFAKDNKGLIDPIFYHFQGISNVDDSMFTIGLNKRDRIENKLVDFFYNDYLKKIQSKRLFLLSKYKISTMYIGHPAHKHHFEGLKRTWIGRGINYLFLTLFLGTIVVRVK